jgi:hypothetical protein
MAARINLVKVFSATRAKERSELGERVTAWIASHQGVEISSAVVKLSSDNKFHCLTIVIFAYEALAALP